MREDKVVKLQQWGIDVPNPDIVNPDKQFIPENYNNRIELNKLER